MKNRFFFAISAFVLVFASLAAGQNNGDFAHGSGQIALFDGRNTNFSFTAKRKNNGSVNGNLIYHQRSDIETAKNFTVHVNINCLTVSGRDASVQGIITKSEPEVIFTGSGYLQVVGLSAIMTVHDGGNANTDEDTASQLLITGTPLTPCFLPFDAYPEGMFPYKDSVNVFVSEATRQFLFF